MNEVVKAQLSFMEKVLRLTVRDAYNCATGKAPLKQRGGKRKESYRKATAGCQKWDGEYERIRLRKEVIGWLGTEREDTICRRLGVDPITFEESIMSILRGQADMQEVERLLKKENGEERNNGKKRKKQWAESARPARSKRARRTNLDTACGA